MASNSTLRDYLTEWTDWDGAAFCLAVSLGLMPDDSNLFSTRAKHVFWSNNPLGNTLHHILEELVTNGVLEKRDEPDLQYRWSPTFRGTWEPDEPR